MLLATGKEWVRLTALICTVLLIPDEVRLMAQEQTPPAGSEPAPKLKSAEELDSLVAPIALYPDSLLGQVLAASTYPIEIVECNRWLKSNSSLKGEELTKAAAKQPWDPSVQALVAFPDALKRLDENIRWTTDLGNAVLDQQSDVMDAIQRMRGKAKDGGKLQSNKEQKVEVKTVENKTVIEIQPSNPQVVYVPSYDPVVVYGAAPAAYAYPPMYYPPYTPGAVAATAAISFGVGVAMGAMWGGCCHGGYGWGCNWGGGGTANININNNFNTRYGYANVNGGNRVNGGNSWQHNPTHRRATPYSSSRTAQRYGGTARGAGGNRQGLDSRNGQGRAGDRGALDRGGQNRGAGDRGGQDRGGQNRGSADRGVGGDRGGGGQDRIGNRSVDSGNRGSRSSALGGGESRSRAEASSNRGFSSSRGNSGGSRSGGGGGGRSGGGGRGGGRGGRR